MVTKELNYLTTCDKVASELTLYWDVRCRGLTFPRAKEYFSLNTLAAFPVVDSGKLSDAS